MRRALILVVLLSACSPPAETVPQQDHIKTVSPDACQNVCEARDYTVGALCVCDGQPACGCAFEGEPCEQLGCTPLQ